MILKKLLILLNILKKLKNFNYNLQKNEGFKETTILKLNSDKAKKELKWSSKWNLNESLKKTIEWNTFAKKGSSIRDLCEKQFLMYINKK